MRGRKETPCLMQSFTASPENTAVPASCIRVRPEGWASSVILATRQQIPMESVYACSYDASLAHSAAMNAAEQYAACLTASGVQVVELRAFVESIEPGQEDVIFFSGPCQRF